MWVFPFPFAVWDLPFQATGAPQPVTMMAPTVRPAVMQPAAAAMGTVTSAMRLGFCAKNDYREQPV